MAPLLLIFSFVCFFLQKYCRASILPKTSRHEHLTLLNESERVTINPQNHPYPVSTTQVSFEQLVSTGLVVSKGSSGVLNFNITLKAVQASTLANTDQAFVQCLTNAERSRYQEMKESYNGNLMVPMMQWLGVNLNGETTLRDMRRARHRQELYGEKSKVVNQVLLEQVTSMVQISGTLMAEGVSIMPTTVFAFIRIARVVLEDGTSMTVLSSNPNDLRAANSCGQMVQSSTVGLDIIDLPPSLGI
ncbi:unnamed protein product [Agarophyton chilense]|eukprot:gb/GEZJ01005890.1/.p1 GENE.gb/GEZJ01005890.1/~~gb/GEZJ01005890.1/.p1  ORF type:complete len:246 (-),score=28.92 gb/GEZJ01005890.1/:219-956(-)